MRGSRADASGKPLTTGNEMNRNETIVFPEWILMAAWQQERTLEWLKLYRSRRPLPTLWGHMSGTIRSEPACMNGSRHTTHEISKYISTFIQSVHIITSKNLWRCLSCQYFCVERVITSKKSKFKDISLTQLYHVHTGKILTKSNMIHWFSFALYLR